MKPSEIAANAANINSFKFQMLEELAKLGNSISNELKNSVDYKHIEYNRQRKHH